MKTIKNNTVSLRELREHFPDYIDAISQGKSFTVMKRSRPVFQIGPVADDENWETIADFTTIANKGVTADDIIAEL